MIGVAAVAAALAVVCWFPSPARLLPRRARSWWWLPVVGLAGGCLVVLEGVPLAAALVVALFAGAFGWVARRGRARVGADETRRRVVEAAEALASELRAGQPPPRGLARASEVWPELEEVAAAARLGADVPDAFRRASTNPGARALAQVASAWSLSEQLGSGLAGALDRVVEQARGELSTRRVIASELASAQATARMVALMPVGLLLMSGGIGGDPWRFLFGTTPGLCCLTAGLALALGGLLWIDAIVARIEAGP